MQRIVFLKQGAYLPKNSSSFFKVMQESFKTYVLATITKQNADVSYLGSYPRIKLLRGVNITILFPLDTFCQTERERWGHGLLK